MSNRSGPNARRPANARRLRARADGIQAAKRQEVVKAGRRLRIGFQIVVLTALGLLAFILVFPTLRLYLAQQVEREQLKAEVEAAAKVNEELEAQLQRWQDSAYVKAQARQLLSFAMPGDRTFRVSDPENAPSAEPGAVPPVESTHLTEQSLPTERDPWYAELWRSAVVAGNVRP